MSAAVETPKSSTPDISLKALFSDIRSGCRLATSQSPSLSQRRVMAGVCELAGKEPQADALQAAAQLGETIRGLMADGNRCTIGGLTKAAELVRQLRELTLRRQLGLVGLAQHVIGEGGEVVVDRNGQGFAKVSGPGLAPSVMRVDDGTLVKVNGKPAQLIRKDSEVMLTDDKYAFAWFSSGDEIHLVDLGSERTVFTIPQGWTAVDVAAGREGRVVVLLRDSSKACRVYDSKIGGYVQFTGDGPTSIRRIDALSDGRIVGWGMWGQGPEDHYRLLDIDSAKVVGAPMLAGYPGALVRAPGGKAFCIAERYPESTNRGHPRGWYSVHDQVEVKFPESVAKQYERRLGVPAFSGSLAFAYICLTHEAHQENGLGVVEASATSSALISEVGVEAPLVSTKFAYRDALGTPFLFEGSLVGWVSIRSHHMMIDLRKGEPIRLKGKILSRLGTSQDPESKVTRPDGSSVHAFVLTTGEYNSYNGLLIFDERSHSEIPIRGNLDLQIWGNMHGNGAGEIGAWVQKRENSNYRLAVIDKDGSEVVIGERSFEEVGALTSRPGGQGFYSPVKTREGWKVYNSTTGVARGVKGMTILEMGQIRFSSQGQCYVRISARDESTKKTSVLYMDLQDF